MRRKSANGAATRQSPKIFFPLDSNGPDVSIPLRLIHRETDARAQRRAAQVALGTLPVLPPARPFFDNPVVRTTSDRASSAQRACPCEQEHLEADAELLNAF